MSDVAFCSSCGRKRDAADARFCAGCGRELEAASSAIAVAAPVDAKAAQDRKDTRTGCVALSVLGVIAALLFVGPLRPMLGGALGPQPVACDEAIRRVGDRHQVLFKALQATLSGSITCPAIRDNQRIVAVSWTWNGGRHTAQYVVTEDNVSAADANARKIDDVGRYGPLALRMLTGG